MSKIIELYGYSTADDAIDWRTTVLQEQCFYLGRKCLKTRKSQPERSIGTCTISYGKEAQAIICPFRFLERHQIFIDCLHLLTLHEPGNELHIIPEVSIPGGNIDYMLVSLRGNEIKDFVGIELQAIDTTGTIWPERQRFLRSKSISIAAEDTSADSPAPYGLNWKMTAKTILVQMHHKIETFQELNKHLVLVIQDGFFNYIRREFQLSHLNSARLGDSAHVHIYRIDQSTAMSLHLQLENRYSTDAAGIAKSLGLQAISKMALEEITKILASKISIKTRFTIVA